jgi:hypothetical protein
VEGKRRILSGALCLSVVLLAAPGARADGSGWTLTESNAERLVARDAGVRVPPRRRVSLEHELQQSFALYRSLELEAELEGEFYAAATFHHLAFRYTHELRKMLNGLKVVAVECTGSGLRAGRDRYMRFRCLATSEPLTIPSATLVNSDGARLPTVIEGTPRIVGPFRTRLSVRVTGRTTIAYRQLF